MKDNYEAPTLTHVGSVESLTAGLKTVTHKLDKAFPAGTPFKKLTFS